MRPGDFSPGNRQAGPDELRVFLRFPGELQ